MLLVARSVFDIESPKGTKNEASGFNTLHHSDIMCSCADRVRRETIEWMLSLIDTACMTCEFVQPS